MKKKYHIYDGFNDEFYEGDIDTIEKTLDGGNPLIICDANPSIEFLRIARNLEKAKSMLTAEQLSKLDE